MNKINKIKIKKIKIIYKTNSDVSSDATGAIGYK